MGAAFISVDQNKYVGIGIHGKEIKNYTGPTYGCIRMTNEHLLIIFDGIQKGTTKINLSAT